MAAFLEGWKRQRHRVVSDGTAIFPSRKASSVPRYGIYNTILRVRR
jgi:hypothetical protein